ncbi:MAG TPA: hypothetical protein PKE45_17405 [Caldilineaceae bacterium]|nr:hypothetical protein [Caldilineaceae bacterium]
MFANQTLIAPALLAALICGACIAPPAAPTTDAQEPAMTKAATGPVPAALTTMEADAEDIMDYVPTGNWPRIDQDARHLAEAWQVYLPQADKEDAPQAIQTAMAAALERLQTAVRTHTAAATLQAANDVSAAVVELFANYNSVIPADIGRLDVLERQVILDVQAGDWTKTAQTLDQTMVVWSKVRSSALAHQGKQAVDQYDASLAMQADWLQARNAAKLTAEVKNGLEIVDALEAVYQ